MHLWQVRTQPLPQRLNNYRCGCVGSVFARGGRKFSVGTPQAKVIPDPSSQAHVKAREFFLFHVGDLSLHAFRYKAQHKTYCLVDSRW